MRREEEKLVHSWEQVTLLEKSDAAKLSPLPRGGEVLKVPLDGARTKWRFRESFLE